MTVRKPALMSGAICWRVGIAQGEQSAFFFKCNITLKI
jgi:hypothetical protein